MCRVLELDPDSADALLGLAMIAFGSPNVQEGLNSGLQYLQRAYAAEPSHPGVLIMLSHFSVVKGLHEEVRGYAGPLRGRGVGSRGGRKGRGRRGGRWVRPVDSTQPDLPTKCRKRTCSQHSLLGVVAQVICCLGVC